MRVKPLIGETAESVWNDADEKTKPTDKDLQHKHFHDVDTLIEQVLKENKQKKRQVKMSYAAKLHNSGQSKMTIFSLKY